MIYEYYCEPCQSRTEIIKPVSEYQRVEHCEKCGTIMTRAFAPSKIHLYGTSVQESYFHPALGQVVKGDNHAKKIAKDKKMIEVGNELPAKHLRPNLQSYDD